MIINTGGRTDTVQFFSEWLFNRFKAGFVFTRNPMFPDRVVKYLLTPDIVDCVVFCSKNYSPALNRLHEITDVYNTYFFYTITPYGSDIEKNVPSIDESIDTLYKLEKIVGKKKIAWRYDPVLLTKKYDIQKHFITFEHMCRRLSGHVDRCIFSFVQIYKKLESSWSDLNEVSPEDRLTLVRGFSSIARRYGITLQSCASLEDYSSYGIKKSGCVTLDLIGLANNVHFRKLKHNGMRSGCACYVWHDIGKYNTCINGCRYCYANYDHEKAAELFKSYDPDSPILLDTIKSSDHIVQGDRKSLLEKIPPDESDRQLFLF